MSHLSPEQLIDALDGALNARADAHLAACAACRDEVTALAATVSTARGDVFPEPSPLFWDRFSARVHDAIAAEPAGRRAASWRQWPVLVPLAGLALLIVALVSAVSRPLPVGPTTDGVVALSPAADEMAFASDAGWAMLSSLIGPLDVETAQQAGIATGVGAADRAVLQLDDAERATLRQLLQAELNRAGG